MKSNMKRFLGILLAALMVVTMLPTVAFAEDAESTVPAGATFVVEDKTFFLLDSTKEINGKTYYGVLSTAKKAGGWGHYKPYANYLTDKTSGASGDIPVEMYLHNDYNGDPTVAAAITNIQTYTDFAAFGNYVAPADTEWVMSTANNAKLYFNGSIGLPTSAELAAVIAKDTDSLIAPGDGEGILTLGLSWYSDYYYGDTKKLDGSASHRFTLNRTNGVATSTGATWYLKTYVSEDFFKNVKLDLATTAADVRAMLAANFYVRDFANSDYTAEELAELGIKAQPDNADTAIDWSPDYVNFAGEDLLYMGTKEANGKTYFGFIMPEDFGGTGQENLPSSIQLTSPANDSDGNPMPNKNYGSFALTTGGRTSLGEFDTYVMNKLPSVISDNLLMNDWLIGNNFGMLPAQNYGGATSYFRMKVSIPSETELTAHLKYLKPMMLDNSICNGINPTGQAAVTRTQASSYLLRIYNVTTNEWLSGPQDRWIGHTSIFPVFYLSEDAFKAEKVDLISVGANVKAAMAATFDKSQLSGIYTDEEMNALGIPGLEGLEGATFLVNDKTFVLMDATKEINGKTYYGVLSTEKLNTDWNKHVMHLNYLNDKVYGDTGDIPVILQTRNPDSGALKDIQDYVTLFSAFGDYIAPETTEWVMRNSTSRVYYTGSIGVPTAAQLIAVDAEYPLTYATNNKGIVPGDLGEWGGNFYYLNPLIHDGETLKGNGGNANVNNNNTSYGSNSAGGTWYFMTYVSEDFFLNTKLDLNKTGSKIRTMMAENFYQIDFAKGLYNAYEFDFLGIAPFGEEVKPEAGTSMKFNVGDNSYILMDATKQIGDKTYYGVLSTNRFTSTYSKLKAVLETTDGVLDTDNTVTFSLQNIEDGGAKTDIQTYATLFSSFGDYIIPSDTEWVMFNSVPREQTDNVKIAYYGSVGVPTRAQVTNIIANDALSIGTGDKGIMVGTLSYWTSFYYGMYTADGSSPNPNALINSATTGNAGGTFYLMTYVDSDFFKATDIDMTTAGDGFKAAIKSNFKRSDLTGWTDANLDILFGGYDGEGLGLEIVDGSSVVVHNNGAEAAGAGLFLIVASYDADGMIDVKTLELKSNVTAGSKTSAFNLGLNTTGATSVKAMLWDSIFNAKPMAGVVSK